MAGVEPLPLLSSTSSEQSGVVVVPHPAVWNDHLLRVHPGVLRGGRLLRQDGDAAVRPLRRLGPLPQRPPAGQLLDPSTDRPAALGQQSARPAGQHGARALRRSAGQRRLLHHG